nr:apical junction molecule-like [Aedes albopictus]
MSERYMVQCQDCRQWYHFSCANVNAITVRKTGFTCVLCLTNGVTGSTEPTPSVISAPSRMSSARKGRLDRELLRLEEERKLLGDLDREWIEKERALNERELTEKLERERQFIARKHELLSHHDDEECRSVRSMRSSQRSTKRTDDWQKEEERETIQELMAEHQLAIETRRKRELELVNRITSLQAQNEKDLRLIRESEEGLRSQLNRRDSEQAALKYTIESLEKQFSEETERMRTSKADLRHQLNQRNQECENLQHQLAELKNEIQGLREVDQCGLTSTLAVSLNMKQYVCGE